MDSMLEHHVSVHLFSVLFRSILECDSNSGICVVDAL